MKSVITLNPVRMDGATQLTIDVEDLVVYVNGEEFDFSPLNVGDMLPAAAISHPLFVSDVFRTAEGLEFSLTFPLGVGAPENARFPEPLVITENGSVEVPEYAGKEPEPIIDLPEIPSEDRLQPESDESGAGSYSAEELARIYAEIAAGGVPAGK